MGRAAAGAAAVVEEELVMVELQEKLELAELGTVIREECFPVRPHHLQTAQTVRSRLRFRINHFVKFGIRGIWVRRDGVKTSGIRGLLQRI